MTTIAAPPGFGCHISKYFGPQRTVFRWVMPPTKPGLELAVFSADTNHASCVRQHEMSGSLFSTLPHPPLQKKTEHGGKAGITEQDQKRQQRKGKRIENEGERARYAKFPVEISTLPRKMYSHALRRTDCGVVRRLPHQNPRRSGGCHGGSRVSRLPRWARNKQTKNAEISKRETRAHTQ